MNSKATAMIIALVFLALPIAADAYAGGGKGGGAGLGMPRGAWWQQESVVKSLSLSKKQQEKIEALTLAHRKEMIELRAQLELNEIDLDPLLSAGKLDEKAIAKKVDEIESVRAKISRSRMSMLIEIRKVLTRDQYLKLKELRGARDRRTKGSPQARGSRGTRGGRGMCAGTKSVLSRS